MNRLRWVGGLVVIGILVAGSAALGQKGEPKLRTVHGTVVNKDENGVATAVVYLENTRTQVVKTYISDDNGRFRFSGLDPNVDYEIHAEQGDMTSAKRTISSFDSRKEIDVTLKLDKKKNAK